MSLIQLVPMTEGEHAKPHMFECNEPIKSFYIKDARDLAPNSNYYILLFIGNESIAHTNKFEKVVIDDVSYYQIDFFVTKFTIDRLPYHSISLYGVYDTPETLVYNNDNDKFFVLSHDTFYEVYIEPDTNYQYSDGVIMEHAIPRHEYKIVYHDSELTNKARLSSHFPGSLAMEAGCDNILIFAGGMAGLRWYHYRFYIVHPLPKTVNS